jgi:hypothetical protein
MEILLIISLKFFKKSLFLKMLILGSIKMKAFTFTTRISENGTIQIPFSSNLFEKEVEIIIIPKQTKKNNRKANAFVKKWAGFLKNTIE